jgi:hypothetical protein
MDYEVCDSCWLSLARQGGWSYRGAIPTVGMNAMGSLTRSGPRCDHGNLLSDSCMDCVATVGAYDRVIGGTAPSRGPRCECGNADKPVNCQLHSQWCPVYKFEF